MSKRRMLGVVATAVLLGGCSTAEPKSNSMTTKETLVIAVISDTPDSTEQMVLGELYERALVEAGQDSTIEIMGVEEDESALHRMSDSYLDLTIGCTGDVLKAIYPDRAAELVTEIAEDPEADLHQVTYEAMIGALPTYLDAPDPSPAEGCGGPERNDGLPQNIVPIYQKSSVSRDALEALHGLGRSLSTESIQEIVQEARKRGSVAGAVEDYYSGSGVFEGGGDQRQGTQDA